jgi:hypothetical protein
MKHEQAKYFFLVSPLALLKEEYMTVLLQPTIIQPPSVPHRSCSVTKSEL